MGLTPPHFPTPPRPLRRRCTPAPRQGVGLSFGASGAFAPLAGLRPAPPASQAGASNPAVPTVLTRSTVGNCAGGALCFNKRWCRLWWVSVRASDLGSPAVNEQLDTRDETGVVRREKQRDLRHFLGFPHATHRDGGYHPRNHVGDDGGLAFEPLGHCLLRHCRAGTLQLGCFTLVHS